MRKIASNYLLTPNGTLLKSAYVLYDGKRVCGWGELSRNKPEEHGVEFYAGMVVPGTLCLAAARIGEDILSFISRIGYFSTINSGGVTLISNLDWSDMVITDSTSVSVIR